MCSGRSRTERPEAHQGATFPGRSTAIQNGGNVSSTTCSLEKSDQASPDTIAVHGSSGRIRLTEGSARFKPVALRCRKVRSNDTATAVGAAYLGFIDEPWTDQGLIMAAG
jgi:hypothetical protein